QDNYTIPGDQWQQLNFSKRYNCSDIGTNYYFFNATNYNGTTNTTSIQTFTVTKDNVTFNYIEGHNSTANRTGIQTTLLSFQAKDLNGTNLSSFPIKYSITTNNVTYYTDNNFIVITDSSGYANLSFNATCANDYSGAPKFLVGDQQWKAEVNDTELSCYYNNDTSNFLYRNLTVMG
ncbi:MAG: hypothetical protein GTN40_01145, partial [Candidatus Aenigmarchaeota archaeon]|nr:hypothetical protein [Candidatus Aenigmarchaeota archaeon]